MFEAAHEGDTDRAAKEVNRLLLDAEARPQLDLTEQGWNLHFHGADDTLANGWAAGCALQPRSGGRHDETGAGRRAASLRPARDGRGGMVRADPNSGFWFHGEWIPDPYEWLERFDDPEVMAWIEEQEAATHALLDAVPTRDRIRAAVTRASRYERLSRPIRAGGRRPATVEFGSPDDPVEGAYLAAYSPYHNIRPGIRYPAIAFVPAMNDKVAPPYDPVKMVARMQADATEGGPYLLLPLRDSGHGGGTTLAALIEQDVDELCFYDLYVI